MKSFVIADDHPLLLRGLEEQLKELGHKIIYQASNGQQAYNLIVSKKPDVAILDIKTPVMTGLEVAELCHGKRIKTKIVLLTLFDEYDLYGRSQELGVAAYLLKTYAQEELEAVLAAVLRGNRIKNPHFENHEQVTDTQDILSQFSSREKKILKLVAKQMTTKEIAENLFVSVKTVEKHRSAIIKKLGIDRKANTLNVWAAQQKEFL